MPYDPASCWADAAPCGSKPLLLYSTPPEAKDLDHILTILGRILTSMVKNVTKILSGCSLEDGYDSSYTQSMKTAISIPDEVFGAAEELSRRLGMSRSE